MVYQMVKLRKLLDANGIEWHDVSTAPYELAGFVGINRTHFEHRGYHWSVVHGSGSYGEKEGLLEVMSVAVNGGEPEGWLTAEQVMDLVKGNTKMTLEQLYEELDMLPREDYIVCLKYKYDYEKEYTIQNELLLIDENADYVWLNDWNEGQTDVEVLGYIAVSNVEVIDV